MIRRRLLTAGLVAASLLSVAACSDDDNGLTIPQTTNPAGGDITLPSGGGDLPVTIPNVPGVPAECMEIINAMSAAGMAAAGQGDMAQAAAYMQGLVAAVPDELKADAQIFADAYAGWLTVLAQYNNDFTQAMTDPAAQQAMMALSTPEVEAASQRLGDYMEATCPNS